MKKPTLAAAAAAITKTILGADIAKPAMVKLPKAVHEIHVSPTEVVPAGTVITEELAELAGFDEETVEQLESRGAIIFVDVLASAVAASAEV